MPKPSYMTGRWEIVKSRASPQILGYIVDGDVFPAPTGGPAFQIVDGNLIDPNGVSLGSLEPLGSSWAVDLGNNTIGHILRPI